jgi:hypothetical protein
MPGLNPEQNAVERAIVATELGMTPDPTYIHCQKKGGSDSTIPDGYIDHIREHFPLTSGTLEVFDSTFGEFLHMRTSERRQEQRVTTPALSM